jgi:hypothetical protein
MIAPPRSQIDPHSKATKVWRRAHAAHAAGRLFDAHALYQQALALEPHHAAALHGIALLSAHFSKLSKANGGEGADDEVVRLLAKACIEAPTNAGAWHNFAKFKQERGELEDAKQLYETALEHNPLQGESWINLGNLYGELGNALRMEAAYLRAQECPTTEPDARYNLSFLKLLKGNFADGWPEYEYRLQAPEFRHGHARPDLTAPKWDGRPLDGHLYVHMEQGVGDAIMMARYIPLAAARCRTLTVEVIKGLVPLFQVTFPTVRIATRGVLPSLHDAQLSLMSCPAVFGTKLDTIPPPAAFSDGIGSIQPESGRIGLCWRGSTTHVNDRTRSMPFTATFPLLDVPGLRWQSLQFGYETSPPLDPLPLGVDFLDTARAIARCALVITVDTSIAHLAASMGAETWILLPFAAEWRWMQARDDSPWYASARLWRQERAGDWQGLTTRVASALVQRFQLPGAA